MSDELSAEDAKLVTLARGARGRVGAAHGAALRDETGRTYAAADVALPSLQLTAVQLTVATAVASGSRGIETVVVVGADPHDTLDLSAVVDLGGPDVPVLLAAPDGTIMVRTTSAP